MNRIIPFAIVLAIGLLLGGGAADAQQHGNATSYSPTLYSKFQQLGRWCGWGWGDGYHARNDSSCRPLDDLPPKSFSEKTSSGPGYLQYRWNVPANRIVFHPPMPISVPQWSIPNQFNESAGLFHPPLEAPKNLPKHDPEKHDNRQDRKSSEEPPHEHENLPAPKKELDELDARSGNSTQLSLTAARLPPTQP